MLAPGHSRFPSTAASIHTLHYRRVGRRTWRYYDTDLTSDNHRPPYLYNTYSNFIYIGFTLGEELKITDRLEHVNFTPLLTAQLRISCSLYVAGLPTAEDDDCFGLMEALSQLNE